jgi:hypothetical protein
MRHRSEAEAPTIAHPTALLVLACGSKTMHAHVNWAKLSRVHKAAKRSAPDGGLMLALVAGC